MIWPKTASRTKNSGDKPYIIGVDTAKDDISSRLAIIPHEYDPTPRAADCIRSCALSSGH